MNSDKIKEELLREASAFGDEKGVRALIDSGVDINSQHSVNGWTALHWAAKRGHTQLVHFLLSKGADTSLTSCYGEYPLSLASNDDIRGILSGNFDNSSECQRKSPLPITPNYLSNPELAPKIENKKGRFTEEWHSNYIPENDSKRKLEEELVLKVRIADSFDDDFIETEVPLNEMTYENVFRICCDELKIEPKDVLKLRKLPNTVVRKDKDVLRFQNFQELELVLKASDDKSAIQVIRNNQPHASEDTNRNVHNKDNHPETNPQAVKKSNFCGNGTILY